MMYDMLENNQVWLSGEVVTGFDFNHEVFGEKFYTFELKVTRTSGADDIIPVMVSDRLVDVTQEHIGGYAKVVGQYRSFNKHDEGRTRLLLYVFVREVEFTEEAVNSGNCICLSGYICKPATYRKTPLGREIADLLLAVNRPYGKSDYIPCICWGRNARFVAGLQIGNKCTVQGRIQSRSYVKKNENGQDEDRIAYEVSVNKIELPDEFLDE